MQFLRIQSVLFVCACALGAQSPAAQGRVIGEVTSAEAGSGKITLRSDQGRTVTVTPGEKIVYLRVPPGEKDLSKASRIQASEIHDGDRVLARGKMAENAESIEATAVIVMTRSDIAQKQERDRSEWQSRGVAGKVTSLDAQGKRFLVSVNSPAGAQTVSVAWSDRTEFRRYAPDSVRFADARPGSPTDIQAGDQVRVLGDREGDSLKAEQVVSGAFRQVAGTVASVNAKAGEIRITDLATKKPLTVRVNEDSTLKKLPPEAAAMMARRFASSVPARGGADRTTAPDLHRFLEKAPGFQLSDLKPGDALIVASTAGAEPNRVTAITMIAGVEPLLAAAPERATNFGGWNFGEIGLPQ
jgi:hypothetical protein